jgi:hypothetical protein
MELWKLATFQRRNVFTSATAAADAAALTQSSLGHIL